MFYNQEILTSRKYGVATIWLVATLGPKSILKKINRKDILRVNVPKACESIIVSKMPLALRLQSNLLYEYGVSKVFDQQCSYVLADANNTILNMKQLLSDTNSLGLDVKPLKLTKPDHLLLQDDPSFVPDLTCPRIDLEILGAIPMAHISNQFTIPLSHRAPHLGRSGHSIPPIVIPSLESQRSLSLDVLESAKDEIHRSLAARESSTNILHELESENGISESVDFAFDIEGNMFEIDPDETKGNTHQNFGRDPSHEARFSNIRMFLGPSINEGFDKRGHDANSIKSMDEANDQLDNPQSAFTSKTSYQELTTSPVSLQQQQQKWHGDMEAIGTAPMRRQRVPRHFPVDQITELANRNVREWAQNYSKAMEGAKASKTHRKSGSLSRRNANYWLWLSGLGNIGRDFSKVSIDHPMNLFHGESLQISLSVAGLPSRSRKRERELDASDIFTLESRRVRSKYKREYDESEVNYDDIPFQVMPHENDDDLEIGRGAESPLLDEKTAGSSLIMPWNASATSARSSSLQVLKGYRRSSLSWVDVADQSMRVRDSKGVESAATLEPLSPFALSNTGKKLGDQEQQQRYGSVPTDRSFGYKSLRNTYGGQNERSPVLGNQPAREELIAPGDTLRVGHQPPKTLSPESLNFLNFCTMKIGEHADVQTSGQQGLSTTENSPVTVKEITFTTLLPPKSSTNAVAAQGFFHLLFLTTTGHLNVRQDQPFGNLFLSPVSQFSELQLAVRP